MGGCVSGTSERLPLLTFERAREIGTFDEFDYRITDEMIDGYRLLTGDDNPLYDTIIPPGFAAIFGRDAYLHDHAMPGGGVLLAQDIQWVKPALRLWPLMVQAVVRSAIASAGRRKLVFCTTARQHDEPVCEVVITAGWPS
jgi:hypothetical protein